MYFYYDFHDNSIGTLLECEVSPRDDGSGLYDREWLVHEVVGFEQLVASWGS